MNPGTVLYYTYYICPPKIVSLPRQRLVSVADYYFKDFMYHYILYFCSMYCVRLQ